MVRHHDMMIYSSKLIGIEINMYLLSFSQKKRDVHKISARNSGAGNGSANFMGAWHVLVLSAGKNQCP